MGQQDERLIYEVRHGDIGVYGNKRYIGHTNWPLSEKGIEQARKLLNKLTEASVSAIYNLENKKDRENNLFSLSFIFHR